MYNLTREQLNNYVNNLTNRAEVEVFRILNNGSHSDTLCKLQTVYENGCSVGVAGFVYYYETEAFFNKYATEILETVEEIKQTRGLDCIQDYEFNKNGLTWLFVEETVFKMVYALGLDY